MLCEKIIEHNLSRGFQLFVEKYTISPTYGKT